MSVWRFISLMLLRRGFTASAISPSKSFNCSVILSMAVASPVSRACCHFLPMSSICCWKPSEIVFSIICSVSIREMSLAKSSALFSISVRADTKVPTISLNGFAGRVSRPRADIICVTTDCSSGYCAFIPLMASVSALSLNTLCQSYDVLPSSPVEVAEEMTLLNTPCRLSSSG